MKKLFIVVTALFLSLIIINVESHAMEEFDFIEKDSKMEIVEGMFLREIKGELRLGEFKSNQEIQILEPNASNENNVHLVPVHAYSEFGWGMKTLEALIIEYQNRNPHLEVLGGINGDFYHIRTTGQSISTTIQDYEIVKGIPSGRHVANFRADGSVDISTPVQDGFELLLIGSDGEIKLREKVGQINKLPTKGQSAILFKKFEGDVSSQENVIKIDANDIKINSNGQYEFAKGNISKNSNIDKIGDEEFIVISEKIFTKKEETDRVVFQARLKGYEDVRGTIGGGDVLVNDGVLTTSTENVKAPRTAIGIKEDGSVFFITTNGRDTINNVPGPAIKELARLMKKYGAVKALNIDGGGSTTMMVKDGEGFRVVNNPSDGRLRTISNGILIVRGDVKEKPIEVIGEDTRTNFTTPTNVHVDHEEIFRFNYVEGATRYIINIDGVEYETSKTEFDLSKLLPQEYKIKVKVKGNLIGKQSQFSEEVTYKVRRKTSNELLEYIKNLVKNNN